MTHTLRMLRALFVALLALLLATTAFAQEEIEVGDTVEGEASEEIVEFEIELEEGQVIVFEIEADWDTFLELYDEDGNFLDSDDDGGDGLQSRLVYNVEDTATYVIRVRAFGDDFPTGDYELSVEAVEIDESVDLGELEYGNDEDVDADDALSVTATFEGSEGDTIDILTVSDDFLYTVMTVLGPDGDDVVETDNFFGDAVVRNLELEEDGTYTIIIEEGTGGVLSGDIEVEVRETEVLSLDDGEVEFEIGDSDDFTFATFTAEDDVVYQVNILFDDEPDFNQVAFYFLEEGTNVTDFTSESVIISGGLGGSFIFESGDDGVYTIRIEYYGSNEIDVTMSVEVLEDE